MVDLLQGAPISGVIRIFWRVPIQVRQQKRDIGVQRLVAGLFDVDGGCFLLQLHPRLVFRHDAIHCVVAAAASLHEGTTAMPIDWQLRRRE